MQIKLSERAVIVRLSIGLPGKNRSDKALSQSVAIQQHMGQEWGKCVKSRFPKWALERFEAIIGEAEKYHRKVTLPWGSNQENGEGGGKVRGVSLLPAPLIMEHGAQMAQWKNQFDALVDSNFAPRYAEMIAWARQSHNGAFDVKDYPPIGELRRRFYFRREVLPVPDGSQFEANIRQLLGADADAVNVQVCDAVRSAQKELLRRIIEPVAHMASRLAETAAEGENIRLHQSIIGNIETIAAVGKSLNIAGDPVLDGFIDEVETLTRYRIPALRNDKGARADAAASAASVLKRLEGYRGLLGRE